MSQPPIVVAVEIEGDGLRGFDGAATTAELVALFNWYCEQSTLTEGQAGFSLLANNVTLLPTETLLKDIWRVVVVNQRHRALLEPVKSRRLLQTKLEA